MYNDQDIVRNIRVFMAESELNQTQLGIKMNYSQSFVSRVIGRTLVPTMGFKLAFFQAFGDKATLDVFGTGFLEELRLTPEVEAYIVLDHYHGEKNETR